MHGCSIFLNFLNLMLYQTPLNQLNYHYILQRNVWNILTISITDEWNVNQPRSIFNRIAKSFVCLSKNLTTCLRVLHKEKQTKNNPTFWPFSALSSDRYQIFFKRSIILFCFHRTLKMSLRECPLNAIKCVTEIQPVLAHHLYTYFSSRDDDKIHFLTHVHL